MLIDRRLADLKLVGYLAEGETVAEMALHDVAAHGRLQSADGFPQTFHLFTKLVLADDAGFKVEQVASLDALLYLSVAHQVQASVTYTGEQESLGCLYSDRMWGAEQTSEDVVHHVFALSIVVQKQGGQPIHLPVMLSEQRFKYFFSFPHTLIIHTKTNLLNPQDHFSCFKIEFNGQKYK